jgi:hypothetical protein
MTRPRLIHPVVVLLEPSVVSETIYDEDAREPVQHLKRAVSVEIPGQVNWGGSENMEMTEGGAVLSADGYVLFLKEDLDGVSVEIKVNDRIKKLGWNTVDLYVVRTQWLGHYPDMGGATMIKAWFRDRAMVRET